MDEDKIIEIQVKKSQKRIDRDVKELFGYHHLTNSTSNRVLRNMISKRITMTVMVIDLVGSTKLSAEIHPMRLGRWVREFSQESTFVIESFGGHVLKYVGDAVIAYFLHENKPKKSTNNSVLAAKALIQVVKNSINPIMKKRGLPKLSLHIGIDHGKNSVLLYGHDAKRSHIDLIGLTLNLAAKMEAICGINQIVIGDNVYQKLYTTQKKKFKKVPTKRWKYYHIEHNRSYPIYESL
jgi:class 3 adenylate cyclase